jgi:hypothetical protein
MDEWNNRRSPPRSNGASGGHENGRREREARDKQALDDKLEEGLEESFPASDPVAVIQPRRSAPRKWR